jgi:uncharacterized membrane protein YcaP (DUF421 family)
LEPVVRLFLKTIVQTMSMMLLWMLLNAFFGIKLGLMFLDEEITIWHGVYYLCMLVSFYFVMRYILAKWKHVPPMGKMDEDYYQE